MFKARVEYGWSYLYNITDEFRADDIATNARPSNPGNVGLSTTPGMAGLPCVDTDLRTG
jgi:hypothetical protein